MTDSNEHEGAAAEQTTDTPDVDEDTPIPTPVLEEAERLSRLERNATVADEREAYSTERQQLLEPHGYTARIRQDDGDDVLVCHPAGWLDGDVVRTERIEDLSRAIERPLEGVGDPDDWDAVEEANRTLVADVRDAHGDVHGDNAAALADFMGNHYAKPIESASANELREFLTEYFVRNAWPSARQRATIERSIALVFETAEKPVPEYRADRS